MMKNKSVLSLAFILVVGAATLVYANPASEGLASQTQRDSNARTILKPVDHTTYGWVLEKATKNPDGTVSIKIMEVPNFQAKTYTTVLSLDSADYKSAATGVSRADALPTVLTVNSFAEIIFNKNDECIDMEVVEYGEATSMDSASYGGELTAKGGHAGDMVAQGWVLNTYQDNKKITIGDGNHYTNIFEQTYTLADDVAIYIVDSPTTKSAYAFNKDGTWGLVRKGSFKDIKVTKKINGEIYYTPERWTALCIFDGNYKSSWKDGRAKVRELYLYDSPITMAKSDMYAPDGMTYSGTSWYPGVSRAVEETNHGYAGSAEPIEFMKDRLYAIGDNYTSVMLYVGDDGTLSAMDMGNSTSRYQYYLNIEKLGYDPRKMTNIFLTHGHFDHYAAMYEFCAMVRRAGNTGFKGWINPYSKSGGTFKSDKGNSYSMAGTLADNGTLYAADSLLKWHAWTDILGHGADMYVWPAMGHSTDVGSFVFKMTAKKGDAFFNEGDVASFLYFGGYAVQQSASAGAMRLALVNSLQYQQSIIAVWAAAQSDYIYPTAQHTNQVSMLEIDKAAKIAGIPFMAAYVGGLEEVGNYCENRIANMLYQSYNTAYENNYGDKLSKILKDSGLDVPQLDWSLMPAAAGGVYVEGTRGTKKLDTIEEHGPFKRPAGEYTITVKAVQVVHGYDAFMNKTPLFADQTNVYGFTLDKGFPILWDTYTHDPEGWWVQVYADVDDNYDGGVDYAANWYTPMGYTTNVDGKGDKPVKWTSGPVELCNPAQAAYEFLRTPRFDTKAEAEAYAKALTNGAYTTPYQVYNVDGGALYKYGDNENHELSDFGSARTGSASYKVRLTKTSDIQLGGSIEETFKKAGR